MRIFMIAVISLILLSCNNDNPNIAVLPDSGGQNKLHLTDEEMVLVDSLTQESVNNENRLVRYYYKGWKLKDPGMTSQMSDFLIDLKDYKRQYVISLDKNGHKIVYVNCLCSVDNMEDWKRQEIVVRDGGICFFNVKVNLFLKTYFEFNVNGSA
jgi:hypothetical protein